MNRKRLLLLALLLIAVVLAGGCRRKEKSPAPGKGRVIVSDAYRRYFGKPPTTGKEPCFAMVGYLPVAADPTRVTPLPLFLFSKKGRILHLVERLLTVEEDAAARVGVINPFPRGTVLRSLKRHGDTMVLDLGLPPQWQPVPGQLQQMEASLGFSLIQFRGIKRISLRRDVAPFPGLKGKAYVPDPSIVSPPGPPVLLAVVGRWQSGAKGPAQVSIFFDRPVTVEKLRLIDPAGQVIEGERFRSVLDMALVIEPKKTAGLHEGMPLEVDFDVRDFQGRTAQGKSKVHLLRMTQP